MSIADYPALASTGELDCCAFQGARLMLTTSDSILTNGNIDSSLLVLSYNNNTLLKKHITDCSFTGSSATGNGHRSGRLVRD